MINMIYTSTFFAFFLIESPRSIPLTYSIHFSKGNLVQDKADLVKSLKDFLQDLQMYLYFPFNLPFLTIEVAWQCRQTSPLLNLDSLNSSLRVDFTEPNESISPI